MSQLAFAFEPATRFGEDDFLVAPSNAEAHGAIARWRDWPGGILLLIGPAGAGKTHLATIWARRAGARTLEPGMSDARWREAATGPSVVDGVDHVRGRDDTLFHFLNRVRELGSPLLLTARATPDRWGIATPDLLSRLRQAPSVSIALPDETLLRAVLVKLFADRQLTVEADLVDYLAQRVDRSLGAARSLVETLDAAALESGRRITRATAARVLETCGREEDGEPSRA